MGNSQFNSSKEGEGGAGGEDSGYGVGYQETRTAPGAPGPFSEARFAPALTAADSRTTYSTRGVGAPRGMAQTGGPTGSRDEMDVESKADGSVEEEDEEEVSWA